MKLIGILSFASWCFLLASFTCKWIDGKMDTAEALFLLSLFPMGLMFVAACFMEDGFMKEWQKSDEDTHKRTLEISEQQREILERASRI